MRGEREVAARVKCIWAICLWYEVHESTSISLIVLATCAADDFTIALSMWFTSSLLTKKSLKILIVSREMGRLDCTC